MSLQTVPTNPISVYKQSVFTSGYVGIILYMHTQIRELMHSHD